MIATAFSDCHHEISRETTITSMPNGDLDAMKQDWERDESRRRFLNWMRRIMNFVIIIGGVFAARTAYSVYWA
jgi:hypothetical protein